MSDEDVKYGYWRRIRFLTLVTTVFVVVIAVILPLYMSALNTYHFLRFPLGYFLVAQAGIVFLVLLVYLLYDGQTKTDRDYNMTIQF